MKGLDLEENILTRKATITSQKAQQVTFGFASDGLANTRR